MTPRKPQYDPNLTVPPEIMEAARKVASWAKANGFRKGWCIGPVSDRAAHAKMNTDQIAGELKLESLTMTRTPEEQAEIESGIHATDQLAAEAAKTLNHWRTSVASVDFERHAKHLVQTVIDKVSEEATKNIAEFAAEVVEKAKDLQRQLNESRKAAHASEPMRPTMNVDEGD